MKQNKKNYTVNVKMAEKRDTFSHYIVQMQYGDDTPFIIEDYHEDNIKFDCAESAKHYAHYLGVENSSPNIGYITFTVLPIYKHKRKDGKRDIESYFPEIESCNQCKVSICQNKNDKDDFIVIGEKENFVKPPYKRVLEIQVDKIIDEKTVEIVGLENDSERKVYTIEDLFKLEFNRCIESKRIRKVKERAEMEYLVVIDCDNKYFKSEDDANDFINGNDNGSYCYEIYKRIKTTFRGFKMSENIPNSYYHRVQEYIQK